MNSSDREHIAVVVNYFWGAGKARADMVNKDVAAVVYEALEEAQACSAAIDLVPRPTYGLPGISYVVKQVAKIGVRIASGDTQIYQMCRGRVAVNFKLKIERALMGLGR
ncbi:hypothetical protein EZI54_21215 [Marinobacter halodurans]|uniref:Uncharacterized protein n=1 Tax=Marinobacter halodurans TaxID=2528979 RepID=A0ABY1ZGJ7_9GAMM|nr:hypothetical protein [Marinobacter halodurans]TBW48515.1 hypothetical protein EZI54_21215 [Marinobacter halodurans]